MKYDEDWRDAVIKGDMAHLKSLTEEEDINQAIIVLRVALERVTSQLSEAFALYQLTGENSDPRWRGKAKSARSAFESKINYLTGRLGNLKNLQIQQANAERKAKKWKYTQSAFVKAAHEILTDEQVQRIWDRAKEIQAQQDEELTDA